MGTTKTEIFTDQQNQLATTLKALAHPARIAILQLLIKANACICGELVNDLGLAQATISQHLKELKNAGLIQGNITGVSTCYCIDLKAWQLLQRELEDFFGSYSGPAKCC